ncbi:hypothetical protein CDAR_440001 [Caerostris darwini]|uniref:Uncharacterized protein n=1 Tax=Caerostris darwini TaxID=1538125 RepID=A0AAV4SIU2_9ARAC|nr:hypothetical protein CDAR_440001 [Caerostris darwini]
MGCCGFIFQVKWADVCGTDDSLPAIITKTKTYNSFFFLMRLAWMGSLMRKTICYEAMLPTDNHKRPLLNSTSFNGRCFWGGLEACLEMQDQL